MLTYCEDKCIIHCQPSTLWLSNIEIVSLGVGSWMASEEGVGRIITSMCERESKNEGVGIGFDGMLQQSQ